MKGADRKELPLQVRGISPAARAGNVRRYINLGQEPSKDLIQEQESYKSVVFSLSTCSDSLTVDRRDRELGCISIVDSSKPTSLIVRIGDCGSNSL